MVKKSWGFAKQPMLKIFILNFVSINTCNNFVYHEIGRPALQITRKLKVIKYWMKLKNSENIIIETCLENREQREDEGSRNTRLELNNLGLGFIWEFEQFDTKLINLTEQRFYTYNKFLMQSNTFHTDKIINSFSTQLAYIT
jgi:hypothetical protein